jgi:hypothetical protein
MALLAECPICHKKQSVKDKQCHCGENLDKAKRSKKVRFWINYRIPGGKQKREAVGFSVEEARDADGKRRSQKRENRIFDVKPDSRMTFNELTEWYLGLERVKSLARYPILKINLKSFNAVFGNIIVNQLKPEDLEKYQMKRKSDGLADSYIDQQIAMARAMINKLSLKKSSVSVTKTEGHCSLTMMIVRLTKNDLVKKEQKESSEELSQIKATS